MACVLHMPAPRSKIPGTPWWCVEDLESLKKAVELNNRSIEKLDTSFIGFQKQHKDWCSSLHKRCASLEALCEQLSGSVQNLLLAGNQQQLRQEHTTRIDQLFEQVHQERVGETAAFNERLQRLESKLDKIFSAADVAVTTTKSEDAAEAIDGTLAMLVNIKGSLEQTHQAIAAVCTEKQSKPEPRSVVTPRSEASPRTQRRASAGERRGDSPHASPRGSSGGTSPCCTRATDAVTPLRKRPPRQAPATQPLRQAVRNTGIQGLGRGQSAATLRNSNDSPRRRSDR